MEKLLYIGNHLRQPNANVSVMDTLGPLLQKEGYQLRYASDKRNKLKRLAHMLWMVWRHARHTDVVLIDTYSTQNFYYAYAVSQLCRALHIPYIPILHGGNLPKRLRTHPRLSRQLFKNAHSNVAPSAYLKNAFERAGYQNIQYIPNTIELQDYPFLNRDMTVPKLLWVRSFSKIYNPAKAIDVLKRLKEQGLEASLCMVGPDADGSLEEVKTLAAQLELNVTFTGKLSKKAWRDISVNYNVFINTTHVDNMPVSLIEAMALGLPIVSTNVGGIPYLIEDGQQGHLVPDNDVAAMVTAITHLMDYPKQRQTMVNNARTLAETFDWNQVRLAWNALLQN